MLTLLRSSVHSRCSAALSSPFPGSFSFALARRGDISVESESLNHLQRRYYKKKKVNYRYKYGKPKVMNETRQKLFVPTCVAYAESRTPVERIWSMRPSAHDSIDEQSLVRLLKETTEMVECLDVVGLCIRRPWRQVLFAPVHASTALSHLAQIYRKQKQAKAKSPAATRPMDKESTTSILPPIISTPDKYTRSLRPLVDESADVSSEQLSATDTTTLSQSEGESESSNPLSESSQKKWRNNYFLYDLLEKTADFSGRMNLRSLVEVIASMDELQLTTTPRGASALAKVLKATTKLPGLYGMNVLEMARLSTAIVNCAENTNSQVKAQLFHSDKDTHSQRTTTTAQHNAIHSDSISTTAAASTDQSAIAFESESESDFGSHFDDNEKNSVTDLSQTKEDSFESLAKKVAAASGLPLALATGAPSTRHCDSGMPTGAILSERVSERRQVLDAVVNRMHWITHASTIESVPISEGPHLLNLLANALDAQLHDATLNDYAMKSLLLRLAMSEHLNSATKEEVCNVVIRASNLVANATSTGTQPWRRQPSAGGSQTPVFVLEKRSQMQGVRLSAEEKRAVLEALQKIDAQVLSPALRNNELSPIVSAQIARALSDICVALCSKDSSGTGTVVEVMQKLKWFEEGEYRMHALMTSIIGSGALQSKVRSADALHILSQFASFCANVLKVHGTTEFGATSADTFESAVRSEARGDLELILEHMAQILEQKQNDICAEDLLEVSRIFLTHAQVESEEMAAIPSKKKSADSFLFDQKLCQLLLSAISDDSAIDELLLESSVTHSGSKSKKPTLQLSMECTLNWLEAFLLSTPSPAALNWNVVKALLAQIESECAVLSNSEALRFNAECVGAENRRRLGVYRLFDVVSTVLASHFEASANALSDSGNVTQTATVTELDKFQRVVESQHFLWRDTVELVKREEEAVAFEAAKHTLVRNGKTYRVNRYGRPFQTALDKERDARGGGTPASPETWLPVVDTAESTPMVAFSEVASKEFGFSDASANDSHGTVENGSGLSALISDEMVEFLKRELQRDVCLTDSSLERMSRSEVAASTRLALLIGDNAKTGFLARNLYKLFRFEKVALCEDRYAVHNASIVERVIQNREARLAQLKEANGGKVTSKERRNLNSSIYHNADFAHKSLLCNDLITIGGGRLNAMAAGSKRLFGAMVTAEEKAAILWRLAGLSSADAVPQSPRPADNAVFTCLKRILRTK